MFRHSNAIVQHLFPLGKVQSNKCDDNHYLLSINIRTRPGAALEAE